MSQKCRSGVFPHQTNRVPTSPAGADDPVNAGPNRRFLPISLLLLPFIFIELACVHVPRRVFDARKPEIEVWSALLHPAVVIWDANL